MNPSKKPKSFQEILKLRQQSSFVGRENQVALFRQNLEFDPEDDRRRFLFNIWGQGGVGKTTLLGQFRAIASQRQGIVGYIDEGGRDVPGVMAQLAADLEKQGHKLTQFSDRYRVYRQKRDELEADPEAPQGFSAFLGRTIAKSAVKLGRRVPGAGIALDFVDEEAFATQAGEWTTYLSRKLTNKDEVHLLKQPVDVLTPLFLDDWGKVAEKTDVTLMFDTYEQTGEFLDEWLRDVLQGQYGNVPLNVLLVVAGREELDRNRWADYEGVLVRLPLEPFSEDDARQYLAGKSVTDERTIEVILNLSGRFPLLLAMLAEGSPNDPAQVGNPSGTAVERFLKWETDPKRRQVALDAALPRGLNQDVIAQLRPDDGAAELFDWLKQKPFVRERTDGWAYHEVVRTQMLRHKRLTSPQEWADLHGKLAEYYDAQRHALQLDAATCQRDTTWQAHTLNWLYHRLCQAPQRHLSIALNEFLAALKSQRKFAERWADVMGQAGRDANVAEVQCWGEQLVEGLKAYDEDRYEVAVAMFEALVEHPDIDRQWQPIARGWRGEIYRLMKRYEEALQDFNHAIELDPNYAWAIAIRGMTYQSMKRYEEAFQDFNQAIDLDPKDAWAIALHGQTHRLMKRYEEALKDFNQVLELDPKYAWAIAHHGVTYQAMERYEEALKDFNQAIELDPKLGWAIASRGETYQAMERYEEALKDFNQFIEFDPKDAGAIACRGLTYQAMERHEEALEDFNQAIELDPKLGWAIALRGQTYQTMERYEEALQDFNQAIQLDPKDTGAIACRGVTYRAIERYGEALKDFNQAIRLDPKNAGAIAFRGETYLLMERYEEALKDFNQFIELNPKNDWAIACRGETYRLMERYEEALKDFNQAIELNPKNAGAIASRGLTYQSMERYEEALKDFNQAIRLDPKKAGAIASRGLTYRAIERYEEALQDFTQAIELDPKYDWAIRERGETYLLIGRYEAALTDFNRIVELDAENDWNLYDRAIAHQTLGHIEQARIDLAQAILLARVKYEKDPEDWRNTFNLALYYLTAAADDQAKHFYRDALRRGAPAPLIRMALQDLADFLTVFPNHKLARAVQQGLQKELRQRSTES